MKHPHSAFITEAMQDMSREIEGIHEQMQVGNWTPVSLPSVTSANSCWKFRFKPSKPSVVSTLSDDELEELWGPENSHIAGHRAVANAACAEERKRICSLPAVTSLTPDNLIVGGFTGFAKAVIAQFLRDIEDGL